MRRALFDALALKITYHHDHHRADAEIALTAGTVSHIADIARDIAGHHPPTQDSALAPAEHGQLAIQGHLALPPRL